MHCCRRHTKSLPTTTPVLYILNRGEREAIRGYFCQYNTIPYDTVPNILNNIISPRFSPVPSGPVQEETISTKGGWHNIQKSNSIVYHSHVYYEIRVFSSPSLPGRCYGDHDGVFSSRVLVIDSGCICNENEQHVNGPNTRIVPVRLGFLWCHEHHAKGRHTSHGDTV